MMWLAPVSAFLAYGSWAAWVNASSDMTHALIAGAIQGTYAFVSTIALRWLVICLLRRMSHWHQWPAPAAYVSAVGIAALVPLSLHMWAGTPRLVASILPGLVVSAAYVLWVLRDALRLRNNTGRVAERHCPGSAGV